MTAGHDGREPGGHGRLARRHDAERGAEGRRRLHGRLGRRGAGLGTGVRGGHRAHGERLVAAHRDEVGVQSVRVADADVDRARHEVAVLAEVALEHHLAGLDTRAAEVVAGPVQGLALQVRLALVHAGGAEGHGVGPERVHRGVPVGQDVRRLEALHEVAVDVEVDVGLGRVLVRLGDAGVEPDDDGRQDGDDRDDGLADAIERGHCAVLLFGLRWWIPAGF